MISTVAGFQIRLDLAYDPDTHLWVEEVGASVRVGLDPLAVESNGTLAAVSFAEVGTALRRGAVFGSLEAEKFVGPLLAPRAGILAAVNPAVLGQPSLVHADPYDAWLAVLTPADPNDAAALVRGAQAVETWFTRAVHHYRQQGVLAE